MVTTRGAKPETKHEVMAIRVKNKCKDDRIAMVVPWVGTVVVAR